MLIGRFTQTVHNKAHLSGRETARAGSVADGAQAVHQSGVEVEPPLEFLPSGLRGNVGTIFLGKLRSAVFSNLEFHLECLTSGKGTHFPRDERRFYRTKQDITGRRVTEPFS